jgi:site-specific recombinase XerD
MDALSVSQPTNELVELTHDPYMEAMATWLEGKPANTRRSYGRAIQALLTFTGKHPGQITPLNITAWKEYLKQDGRSDATIAQRLSAVSSYFTCLQRPQADGQPLHLHNPVQGVERVDLEVSPYDRAKKYPPKISGKF